MSNSDKRSRIPEAPTPTPAAVTGNLLSSVAPPTELPNFFTSSPLVTQGQPVSSIPVSQLPPSQLPPSQLPPLQLPLSQLPPLASLPSVVDTGRFEPPKQLPVQIVPPVTSQQEIPSVPSPEKFSAAIPPSKGESIAPVRSPDDSQTTHSIESLPSSTPEIEKLGDVMPGSGIFTWVKGAVSSGGILSKVAEKAKSSVDSMITTLDPQMKEYLNSGGDTYIVVASDKDMKVSPIRESFQTVFGKATVVGYPAQSDVTAEQPISYAAAYAAAKQRIAHIRSTRNELNNNVPVVAIESFLHEACADRWFDIALLVLSQPSLGIELQIQSQGTPVPSAAIAAAKAATPDDYIHCETGFAVTIGSIMAASLQVPHTQWQEASTCVSRKDLLSLAARSLAGSYRKLLQVSAAET